MGRTPTNVDADRDERRTCWVYQALLATSNHGRPADARNHPAQRSLSHDHHNNRARRAITNTERLTAPPGRHEVKAEQPEGHHQPDHIIAATPSFAEARLSRHGGRTRRDEVAVGYQPHRALARDGGGGDGNAGGVVTAFVPRASIPGADAAHPAVRISLEADLDGRRRSAAVDRRSAGPG